MPSQENQPTYAVVQKISKPQQNGSVESLDQLRIPMMSGDDDDDEASGIIKALSFKNILSLCLCDLSTRYAIFKRDQISRNCCVYFSTSQIYFK